MDGSAIAAARMDPASKRYRAPTKRPSQIRLFPANILYNPHAFYPMSSDASGIARHQKLAVGRKATEAADVPGPAKTSALATAMAGTPLAFPGLMIARRNIGIIPMKWFAIWGAIAFVAQPGLAWEQANSSAPEKLSQAPTFGSAVRVTGLDAMFRMIQIGLGIGVMPQRAFELIHGVGAGDLVSIPLTDPWADRRIDVVARDFSTLPVAAKLLVDHLASSDEQAG